MKKRIPFKTLHGDSSALEGVTGEQDHFPPAPGGDDSMEIGSRSPSLPPKR